jgi:hypothetical protein
MATRLLTAVFALCLTAWADNLSVQQLVDFLQNAAKTSSDKDIAAYLSKVRLTERLDSRTIETIQGYGAGPKTVAALQKLLAASSAMAAPAPLKVVEPAKPAPPPSSEAQAEIIAAVREYALNYSRNLPDFICAQVTKRSMAPAPGGKYHQYAGSGSPAWQTIDTLTIRLSYFDQKENYKLLLRNNMPSTEDYAKVGGPKSFGDFGSLLREVFEQSSQARFEWDHWGTLRGQSVMAFAYRVPQATSQYRLAVEEQNLSIVTGYRGLVLVDATTHEVLRVTVEAENIPRNFPIKTAETRLDYEPQNLSGHKFLLPSRSQILMSGTDVLNRIELSFKLYRKYSAESELKFDSEVLPPLPDGQPNGPAKPAAPHQ